MTARGPGTAVFAWGHPGAGRWDPAPSCLCLGHKWVVTFHSAQTESPGLASTSISDTDPGRLAPEAAGFRSRPRARAPSPLLPPPLPEQPKEGLRGRKALPAASQPASGTRGHWEAGPLSLSSASSAPTRLASAPSMQGGKRPPLGTPVCHNAEPSALQRHQWCSKTDKAAPCARVPVPTLRST